MSRMLSPILVLAAFGFASIGHRAYGVDPSRAGTTNSPSTTAFIVPSGPADPSLIPGVPGTDTTGLPPFARDRLSVTPGTYPPGTLPPGGITPQLLTTPGTPNMPSRGPRWRLGVYSQDTNIGVKILRTAPNSPADRAGLEPNDVIVNVAGYQVGIVNGQQYDCGNEFELRADSQGNCMLLVLDSRSRTVVNLPIQLESRLALITGTIAYRNRYVLPPNAVALVELREASLPGSTSGLVLGALKLTTFDRFRFSSRSSMTRSTSIRAGTSSSRRRSLPMASRCIRQFSSTQC
ncbi:MAG: hypothetical protein U0992_09735 [Planctomycetaceae bacterium]